MLFNSLNKPDINYQWSAALSKRWRNDIIIRAFKPITDCGLSGLQVDQLFIELYPSLSNRAKTPVKQALQAALLNLCLASEVKNESGNLTGFLCQTTSQTFKMPKRYAVNDFSLHTFANVLKKLAKHGYLNFVSGFKGKGHYSGLASIFYPSQRFVERFKGEVNQELKVTWFKDELELVYLKNESSKLIDYDENQSTLSIRHNVKVTNVLRLAHRWFYTPIDIKATRKAQAVETEICVYSNFQAEIAPRDLVCKRVFNGSIECGGRFYANAQTLRKLERATIRVNNEPTIELDIKSLHPRILYNLSGLEAPADCYSTVPYPREHAKQAMLIMLNADSDKAACLALSTEFGMPHSHAKDIIKALAAAHSPISEYFFTSSWKLLQYEDSCLTESIMLEALKRNIPVLPIHDSYITATRYGFELRDIIQSCYKKRFSFDCVVTF